MVAPTRDLCERCSYGSAMGVELVLLISQGHRVLPLNQPPWGLWSRVRPPRGPWESSGQPLTNCPAFRFGPQLLSLKNQAGAPLLLLVHSFWTAGLLWTAGLPCARCLGECWASAVRREEEIPAPTEFSPGERIYR